MRWKNPETSAGEWFTQKGSRVLDTRTFLSPVNPSLNTYGLNYRAHHKLRTHIITVMAIQSYISFYVEGNHIPTFWCME